MPAERARSRVREGPLLFLPLEPAARWAGPALGEAVGATGSSTAREASARVLLKLAVAAPPSLRRVPYYPASLQTVAPTQNDCWWVKP
jgi:hypothetical protein